MSDLEGLLKRLDSDRLTRLDFEVDDAYKKFPLDKPTVDAYPEFLELLGRYYQHLTRAVHHCDVAPDRELAEGFVVDVVERGFEGGRVEAFERAKNGYDGGLPGVLQKIGEAFKARVLDAWLHEALRKTVDMEDWEAREQLMRSYVDKYRHLLPSDIASTTPMVLATRIEEVLRAHMQAQPLLHKLPKQK